MEGAAPPLPPKVIIITISLCSLVSAPSTPRYMLTSWSALNIFVSRTYLMHFTDAFSTNVIVGMKLNSLFVPESESCYIPQVCRVCQLTGGDSHIVGLEVMSLRSSSERGQRQPIPLKQVMNSVLTMSFPNANYEFSLEVAIVVVKLYLNTD